MRFARHLFSLAIAICLCANVFGQEENSEVTTQAGKYIGLKIASLDNYNHRIERQQQHILSKLRKKEHRFAKKLQKHDSAAYAKYSEQSLSYDSINTLSKTDSGTEYDRIAKKKNGKIDSLKKISSFAEGKGGGLDKSMGADQSAKLNELKGDLNYRNHINELISKRTSFLKGLAGDNPAFKGIEKQAFYGKSKMKVFKEMEDEPTAAEDKAMEYLQGTEGFDKHMSGADGGSRASGMSGMDAGQMEKMGYQTKQMMQKSLTDKFGSSLGGITGKMGDQLKGWQDKQKDAIGSFKDSKNSLNKIKNTDKPSFKVNPMRGLPFMKRIEKQYSWQTQRADGTRPATLDMSGSLGFRHTPKLTYGVGLVGSLGLGQGWQQIHFSFEGIGLKTFATWEWQYGIGAYTGYERLYKRAAFVKEKEPAGDLLPTMHSTQKYSESILVGLTKSYNINKKYKGSIQLLYDIWWQQKELRSPIVLRFVTTKK